MQLVIIGPSGVGKSVLADYAEKEVGLKHINLDEIFQYRGKLIGLNLRLK